MIIGTNCFPRLTTAITYYAQYSYGAKDVRNKIKEGEITIGLPELKPGQKVVMIDRGLRYGIECEETNCINGFMFNDIGDLISKPETYTKCILIETYDKLIKDAEYIRASRINHLINIFEE